jgi:hypothetical protein
MFEALVTSLAASSRLFIGADISGAGEYISCKSIEKWRQSGTPELGKRPAVYGIFHR